MFKELGKIIIWISNKITALKGLYLKSQLAHCGNNVCFVYPYHCYKPQNIYLYDNTNIFAGFIFISHTGKFIMKKNSGAAQGLTVITGNHYRNIGTLIKKSMREHSNDIERDIVVDEDVWIGANVTLLDGSHIGRGATIGAGSVVRSNIPPYAVVIGNPARIIGFNFTPEEIIEHEKMIYPEEERIRLDLLQKNYKKYYLNKIDSIVQYLK